MAKYIYDELLLCTTYYRDTLSRPKISYTCGDRLFRSVLFTLRISGINRFFTLIETFVGLKFAEIPSTFELVKTLSTVLYNWQKQERYFPLHLS